VATEAYDQKRLSALLEAGIALTSELSLDAVLQKLVETAGVLTRARYAALGVIDSSGKGLERFLTHGIDPETHQAIGELPKGRGILGVLIREAKPLRLHNLSEDPHSVGFPPNHPPMRTFLGVPIMLRGVAFGNLYLAEKEDGTDFSAEDEELERLVIDLVASKTGKVFQRKRSERVDSVVDDPEVDQAVARRMGATTSLHVPLVVRERAIGVMSAHDKLGSDPRFTEDDLRLAEAFAARATIAVDLSKRVTRDALRHAVEAQELERRRLARELHDEIGQDLTSILLTLKRIEEGKTPGDIGPAAEMLRELVVTALQDVRRLAVELRPKALDDFGLVPALERLGQMVQEQTEMSVEVQERLGGERLPADVETAFYRIVQEALTNVVKHARAGTVSILLTHRDGSAAAVVEDDGQGFDPSAEHEGLGLLGIRERLGLLDGRLRIESSPGKGTTLVAEVPLR